MSVMSASVLSDDIAHPILLSWPVCGGTATL
jgi:hypothetical protein